RLRRTGLEERFARAPGLADDLDVVLRIEEHAQPGAHDRVVVHDQDADHGTGTSATIVVPAPGDDSMSRRPSSSPTRSRMPTRPRPCPSREDSCAKPTPLSSTTAVTERSFRTTTIVTRVARACVTTFVSASCTIR